MPNLPPVRLAARWRRCWCTPRSPRRSWPQVAAEFASRGVELRGCAATRALLPQARPATEEDWFTEYLGPILARADGRLARHRDSPHRALRIAPHRLYRQPRPPRHRALPARGRLRLGDGQRADLLRRRLRVRPRRGDRHLDRTSCTPAARSASRALTSQKYGRLRQRPAAPLRSYSTGARRQLEAAARAAAPCAARPVPPRRPGASAARAGGRAARSCQPAGLFRLQHGDALRGGRPRRPRGRRAAAVRKQPPARLVVQLEDGLDLPPGGDNHVARIDLPGVHEGERVLVLVDLRRGSSPRMMRVKTLGCIVFSVVGACGSRPLPILGARIVRP